MRSNEIQREQDIENLESASHSVDPAEQTTWPLCSASIKPCFSNSGSSRRLTSCSRRIALQQIVAQKQQQDAMKAGSQDAADYNNNYQTNIAPINNGAAQALNY